MEQEILNHICPFLSPADLFRLQRTSCALYTNINAYLPSATKFCNAILLNKETRLYKKVHVQLAPFFQFLVSNKKEAFAFNLQKIPSPISEYAFASICHKGYLELAQWLVTNQRFTPKTMLDLPLQSVCVSGQLHILKWIVLYFNIIAELEKDRHKTWVLNNPIHLICINGHFDVLVWFTSTFHAFLERIHILNALRSACIGGHLNIVEWMVNQFHITDKKECSESLYWACARGNLHVVQWLTTKFSLERHDFSINENLMRDTCKNDQKHVLEWLNCMFPRIVNNYCSNNF